jgi:hypothetical protein
MAHRTIHVDAGTIGPAKCDAALADLLTKHPEYVRRATNLLHEFRTGLNTLTRISESQTGGRKSFMWQLTLLWFDDHKRRVNEMNLLDPIRNYLHTCLKASWRNWLKQRRERAA